VSAVDTSKWTCPSCSRTVTVYGSPAAVRCCITAEQKRHGRIHAQADHVRALGIAGVRARRRAA
jgi:hypothetical protein